jgi:superfamily II DNA or RNA helicase
MEFVKAKQSSENKPDVSFEDLLKDGLIRNGEYNTNDNDLVVEFYTPILGVAQYYDRATGSFSIAGVKALAKPLVPFVRNALRTGSTPPVMRVVASHDISELDYDQINRGYENREKTPEDQLIAILDSLKKSSDQELLEAIKHIGTMVQLGLLDIKIGIPSNKLTGMFHRKAGVFRDFHGNVITFEGSQNFTRRGDGSEVNLEGLVAFCTHDPAITSFKEAHMRFFDSLWNDKLENVRVKPLSKYPKELLAEYGVPIEEILRELEPPKKIVIPRQCQRDAVTAWVANGNRGILDMCTGSGKSRAALMALERLDDPPLTLIITGNLIDLVDQWADREIIPAYGSASVKILKVSSSHGTQSELQSKLITLLQDFRFDSSKGKRVFILSTIQSASQEWFRQILSRFDKSRLAIIIDEVHHAGASGPTGNVLKIDAKYRLGLSATWRRYDDDEDGRLEDYFRGKTSSVPYSYPLAHGIRDGVLSPYQYYIHAIKLDSADLDELRQRLTQYDEELKKIDPSLGLRLGDQVLAQVTPNELPKLHELRDSWRSTLGRAIAKTDVALQIVESEFSSLKKCIIYCAGRDHLDRTSILMGQRHWQVEPYDSQVQDEIRARIRDKFALPYRGQPFFIGAIKCLDEGIDLPALDSAILVASNKTEREWIQRRGRILRIYPGKEYSIIHDFVMLPYSRKEEAFALTKLERDYVMAELDRLESFGIDALNREEVLQNIRNLRGLFPEV